MIFGLSPNESRLIEAQASGIGAKYGTWPAFDPMETSVDYWIDFSALLTAGQTIAQVNVRQGSNTPVPPTIVKSGWDAISYAVFLSGGSDGDTATFALQVTLSDGSQIAFQAVLPIRATVPGLVVNGGALAVFQFGDTGALDVAALPIHTADFEPTDMVIVLSQPATPGGPLVASVALPGQGPNNFVVGNDPRLNDTGASQLAAYEASTAGSIAVLTGKQSQDEATIAALGLSITTMGVSNTGSFGVLSAGLAAETTARAAAIATLQGSLAAASATATAALPAAQVGVSVAPLVSGKVPLANMDPSILGSTRYIGTWNAAANIPGLMSSVAPAVANPVGAYYIVQTPGSTILDGEGAWGPGDWLVWNGATWSKIDGAANPVGSVAGLQGAITGAALKTALAIAATDVSGLQAPATAPFGVNFGQVADGGVLAGVGAIANAAATSQQLTAGLATEAAARAGQALSTGAYDPVHGTLSFTTAGGGTVSVGGTIGITSVGVSLVNTGVGGGNTGSVAYNNGALTLSIGLQTISGNNGGPGPVGPVSPMGTPAGTWNPATNSPSLASGGAGAAAGSMFSIGGSLNAMTTLATAIDGTTVVTQGDQFYQTGGSWMYIPRVGIGNFAMLQVSNTSWRDSGNGVWGHRWADQAGRVWAELDTTNGFQCGLITGGAINATSGIYGTITCTSFVGPFPTTYSVNGDTLLAVSQAAGQATLASMGVTVTWNNKLRITLPDGKVGFEYDLITSQLSIEGGISIAGVAISASGGSTTSFGQADMLANDTYNLAYGAAIRAMPVLGFVQAPNANHCLALWDGQSKAMGEQGQRSLTTTQPLDNLQIGNAPRPLYTSLSANNSAYTATGTLSYLPPGGSTGFQPLICVDQASNTGSIITTKTGVLSNVFNVTVLVGSGGSAQGTFLSTGVNFPGTFAAGDTLQVKGFTNDVAQNTPSSNTQTLTVVSSAVGTLVVAEGNQCTPTSAAESGITFAQVAYSNFGEVASTGALNEWRALNLATKQLSLDPSRLFVAANASVSGMSIAQLSPGATPPLWNRASSACSLTVSESLKLNPANKQCLTLFSWNQGGSDAASGTSFAQYKASFAGVLSAVNSQLTGIMNQTLPPLVLTNVVCGGQLYDTPDTAGISMPVTMAQADMAGCRPPLGVDGPPVPAIAPNVVCVGPDSFAPDRNNYHLSATGYRWDAAMYGKILHILLDLGIGWRAMHRTRIIVRGNQVLVGVHTPVPPVELTAVLVCSATVMFADGGFTVTDPVGARTVTCATFGRTGFLLSCAGAPLQDPVVVNYGDRNVNNSGHAGNGNASDSDPAVSIAKHIYLGDGSGQVLTENFPGPISPTQPISNNQPFPLKNFLINFSETAVRG